MGKGLVVCIDRYKTKSSKGKEKHIQRYEVTFREVGWEKIMHMLFKDLIVDGCMSSAIFSVFIVSYF